MLSQACKCQTSFLPKKYETDMVQLIVHQGCKTQSLLFGLLDAIDDEFRSLARSLSNCPKSHATIIRKPSFHTMLQ